MIEPSTSMERRPEAVPAAPVVVGKLAFDDLDRLERELLADPCNLVRRACQIADYETAPGGEPDETAGR